MTALVTCPLLFSRYDKCWVSSQTLSLAFSRRICSLLSHVLWKYSMREIFGIGSQKQEMVSSLTAVLIFDFNDILIWQPCHRWLSVACRSFCFGCWRRSAGARARLGSVSHHCPSVPSEMPLPRKIKSGIRTPHLQCGHWSTSRQIGNSVQISTTSILGQTEEHEKTAACRSTNSRRIRATWWWTSPIVKSPIVQSLVAISSLCTKQRGNFELDTLPMIS